VISQSKKKAKPPVFIVGSPRSGTTLLYHMLLSAGGFAIYRSETQVLHVLGPSFGQLRTRRDRERLLAAWLGSERFRRTGLAAESIRQAVLEECRTSEDFLDLVMSRVAESQQAERWADCSPEHLLYMRRIQAKLPGAVFVHIIRDGRDVELSMAQQGWIRPFRWEPGGKWLAAGLYWRWLIERGRREARGLRPNSYVELRFEDLIRDPRETLHGIGAFIDHDLDYNRIQKVAIGSISKPNTSFVSGRGEGSFRPVGRWRNGYPQGELARLELVIGSLLDELGYARSETERGCLGLRTGLATFLYPRSFAIRTWLKSLPTLGRVFATAGGLHSAEPAEEADPTLRPGEHPDKIRSLVQSAAEG
jgi:hypothetical protein